MPITLPRSGTSRPDQAREVSLTVRILGRWQHLRGLSGADQRQAEGPARRAVEKLKAEIASQGGVQNTAKSQYSRGAYPRRRQHPVQVIGAAISRCRRPVSKVGFISQPPPRAGFRLKQAFVMSTQATGDNSSGDPMLHVKRYAAHRRHDRFCSSCSSSPSSRSELRRELDLPRTARSSPLLDRADGEIAVVTKTGQVLWNGTPVTMS